MNKDAYLIITIIVFIVVVICIIVWITSLHHEPNVGEPQQFSKAGLYQSCVNSRDSEYTSADPKLYTPQICDIGLVCIIEPEQISGICRKSEGSSCTTLMECEPDMKMCFQNICAISYTGGLNQEVNYDGTCNEGLIIDEGLCKVPLNGSCNNDMDCAEGQCLVSNFIYPDERICAYGRNNTESCEFSDQCISKFCDFSTSQGICQPTNLHTGDYRASCKFYLSQSQNTACFEKLSCNYNFSENNNNIGSCLDTNYTWPDGAEAECSQTLGGCIVPSVCINQKCVLPINNPLSCAFQDSSGYCIKDFTCSNNLCVPNSDQPGHSDKWGLIQWNRSTNNQMGSWVKLYDLDPPGFRPIVSNLDTSTGLITVYASDVSINTPVIWDYKYINKGVISTLGLFFTLPSDWVGNEPVWTPRAIRFIPTNNVTLIGILINIQGNGITPTSWVLTSYLPLENNITFRLPTRASVNLSRNNVADAYDFQLILKGSVGIPKIMYRDNTTSYFGDVISSFEAYTLEAATHSVGPSLYQILDLNSFIDLAVLSRGTINILYIYRVVGIPNVIYHNTSLNSSSQTNLEILYLTNFNQKYYIGYVYGFSDVILPMEANEKSVPSISVLDSTLSGSTHQTTLTILTSFI